MYVKLLSVTDDRISAWKHSRKLGGDAIIDMEQMDKTPFSLHSLKRYVFEVEMARVMLDLMVNFTKDMWAQSSRINPIPDLELDMESYTSQLILDKLKDRAKSGEPQDILRLGSPILTKIGWTFSMDHRTLIGFLKSLKFYQPKLFNRYGIELMKAIDMDPELLDVSPFGELVPRGLTMEDFKLKDPVEGIRYIEGIGVESYNFISQLNRHADTHILTSLWVMNWSEIENHIMSDHIFYMYCIGKNVYNRHILSHRACWIADWNNWSDRIAKVYKTSSEIKDLLPCKACKDKCVFKADLQARIDGKDPNLPCPIATGKKSYLYDRILREGNNFMTEMFKDFHYE